MPIQDLDRVGFGCTVHRHSENTVLPAQEAVSILGSHKFGMVKCRDRIACRAAIRNLVERNGVGCDVKRPLPFASIKRLTLGGSGERHRQLGQGFSRRDLRQREGQTRPDREGH